MTSTSASSHEAAPSKKTSKQRLTNAEIWRLWAPGGARGWIITSGALAVIGALAYLILEHFTAVQDNLPYSIGGLAYAAPMSALIALALAIMSKVPNDRSNGLLFTSFSRVPRHTDVFWARLRSWAFVGLGVSLSVTVAALLAGLALNGAPAGSPLDWALALLCANLTLVASLALVFAISSCLRNGAGVVAITAAIFLILPMAVLIAQSAVSSDSMQSLLSWVNSVLPGNLLATALSAPEPHHSWMPTLSALGGIIVWSIVAIVVARALFVREDYIQD